MYIVLLIVELIIALAVTWLVVRFTKKPIEIILEQIVPEKISEAWAKLMRFAIYVVGIRGGVTVVPQGLYNQDIELTLERWVLEIAGTIMGTLTSIAVLLFVFFLFTLIALVIVRLIEARTGKSEPTK